MGETSTVLLVVVVAGLVLGFALPTNQQLPYPFDTISSIVGWMYFTSWSVSFYPQVWLNWRRKSVVGLSFDFLALNLLGWICYSTFNVLLYFWPHAINPDGDSTARTVELNDVAFAVHALVLTLITAAQCCIYERGRQRISRPSKVIVAVCGLAAFAYACAVATVACQRCHTLLNWLSFVYFLSYIKLGVSLTKYIPQLLFNARRKSTVGWSILNVLLDFTGGVLSVAQVIISCAVLNDWTPIIGNPVKFGLGSVSLVFDTAFIVQHYILYRERPRKAGVADVAVQTAGSMDLVEAGGSLGVAQTASLQHELCKLLRFYAEHVDKLPTAVCEELCQQCGAEHGIDVDLPRMLRHFCQHPEDLPMCPSLLAQRCAEAAAMANSSDSGTALPPEQEPLLAREHARGLES